MSNLSGLLLSASFPFVLLPSSSSSSSNFSNENGIYVLSISILGCPNLHPTFPFLKVWCVIPAVSLDTGEIFIKFRLFSFAWYRVRYEFVNKVDEFIAARGIRFLNLWLMFNPNQHMNVWTGNSPGLKFHFTIETSTGPMGCGGERIRSKSASTLFSNMHMAVTELLQISHLTFQGYQLCCAFFTLVNSDHLISTVKKVKIKADLPNCLVIALRALCIHREYCWIEVHTQRQRLICLTSSTVVCPVENHRNGHGLKVWHWEKNSIIFHHHRREFPVQWWKAPPTCLGSTWSKFFFTQIILWLLFTCYIYCLPDGHLLCHQYVSSV